MATFNDPRYGFGYTVRDAAGKKSKTISYVNSGENGYGATQFNTAAQMFASLAGENFYVDSVKRTTEEEVDE